MSPQEDQDPAPPRLDPLPGRVIAGNFRIDGLIGSGAMGNVYKAEQLSLGKQVAIKVLHPHLMGDDKLVGRFKREAKSASLLNHPNSIQIIDSGQDRDGTLYIAMELLTGRDLAQVIRDDFPLPLPRVVRILAQVLSALEEAHAQRVIHRDLKPSNIMLIQRRDEKDFVKVCDFGIAKATLSEGDDRAAMLTIQGLVCGTPEYMAPEQARAEPLDGRADLYAAAVILYQMVTGDIPFRADSPMAIVSRHLVEAPMPPSKRRPDLRLPKIVDDVVLRGLEKEREMRYPTAVAFREVLEGVLGATSGPATPVAPSARAAQPTVRDISGHDLTVQVDTGTIPAQSPSQKFGTTANLTGRPKGQTPVVVAGIALLAAVSIAGAIYTFHARTQMRLADQANVAAIEAARSTPLPPPVARPAAAEPAPPAAVAEPTPAVVAPPAGLAPATEHETALRDHGKHHHAASPAARPIASAAAPAVTSAPAAPVIAPSPAPAPPPRGAVEVLAEADKLLGQGEVADACSHGEEAKRMSPRLAAVYKFLGKCYMRAGRAPQANDNYKKYLELAPNASDAPFVKSMIEAIPRRIFARAGLLGIAFLAGCKVDQAAFDNRIFTCDPSAKDPGCGSDANGKPMVCYPASQLDGTDFCAPSCDTVMSLAHGNQCVEGNAELKSCNPAPDAPANECGQSTLGCLRTDVTTDEGICTTMIPCTEDKDCKDPVRSTCAATFLTQLYSKNTTLKANNLYCLQKNCQSGASSCSPGQSCLPLLVPAAAHAPDICVPNCDSAQDCPPNHVCFQKISGPANPAICIPGLLGFICEADINCLVGKCLSDGDPVASLNLCSVECKSDADCAVYDSNQGTFACIPRSDGNSYCEAPYSYRGNACRTDDDCVRNGVRDTSTSCYFQSPPEKPTDVGTCLRSPSMGDCASRAGLGQTPVPFYASDGNQATACFPGFFGLPCLGNANCTGDMTCREAIPNVASSSICTALCQTDADCNADRWTAGQSFCAPSGVCAPLLAGGQKCHSNNWCQSKACQITSDGGAAASDGGAAVGTCAEPTP